MAFLKRHWGKITLLILGTTFLVLKFKDKISAKIEQIAPGTNL